MPYDIMSEPRLSQEIKNVFQDLTPPEKKAVRFLYDRSRNASARINSHDTLPEELLTDCIETVQFEGPENVLSKYGFYADAPVVSEHWRNIGTLQSYKTPLDEKKGRRKKT